VREVRGATGDEIEAGHADDPGALSVRIVGS
jgi:hypothetical protein